MGWPERGAFQNYTTQQEPANFTLSDASCKEGFATVLESLLLYSSRMQRMTAVRVATTASSRSGEGLQRADIITHGPSKHSCYVPTKNQARLNLKSIFSIYIPSLANPCTPVRFRYSPPKFSIPYDPLCSLGYHLGYQFLVLCRFCSWLLPFGCGLTCPHHLARLTGIFDNHLVGCVAAVVGTLVDCAPGRGKLHDASVAKRMLVKSHQSQALTFFDHHPCHGVIAHRRTV